MLQEQPRRLGSFYSIVDKLTKPLFPEVLMLPLAGGSEITTVVDARTLQYHEQMVADIAEAASNGHGHNQIEISAINNFGDGTWRAILTGVTGFSERGIKKAVVVGFATGPTLRDGKPSEQTNVAERAMWFNANVNSLLHHTPPWVKEVCLTIPHFEARSDRDALPGEAAMAEIVANSIVGAIRKPKYVVTLEDHSHRLHKYLERFGIKHVAVTANRLLAEAIIDDGFADPETVDAAPDIGAVGRNDNFTCDLSELLQTREISLVILDKERNLQSVNESHLKRFILETDVKDKTVIIRDDLGDGWSTVTGAAKALKDKGAKRIIVALTQAVDSGPARERIEKALANGVVDEIYITDSRPLTWEKDHPHIHIVPVGQLLGEISASLLAHGLSYTRKKYARHLFQPEHPSAALEKVFKRRNHVSQTIFFRR